MNARRANRQLWRRLDAHNLTITVDDVASSREIDEDNRVSEWICNNTDATNGRVERGDQYRPPSLAESLRCEFHRFDQPVWFVSQLSREDYFGLAFSSGEADLTDGVISPPHLLPQDIPVEIQSAFEIRYRNCHRVDSVEQRS
jgi:hypothetical protein